jgi:cation diffusion facilitator family transporter
MTAASPNSAASKNPAAAIEEKNTVALRSLLAAVALAAVKVVVGLWTNSLGILAEAAHSALDLVAAAITLWAVRASAAPPDSEHPYGHGKFENMSALVETLLLFGTCVWIIYEAVRRLTGRSGEQVDANIWAFLVVILSIVVDVSRSRALSKAAEKHRSQALEADALHFSTDIWSSAVVLIGLLGVLGARLLDVPMLANADSAAALGVAVIVVFVSLKLGRKSINDLVDAVPKDIRAAVIAAARAVPGVAAVRQARVRRSGPEHFADVTVAVGPDMPLAGSHDVADAVEAAVDEVLDGGDVVVHVEPLVRGADPIDVVRGMVARKGLRAHSIMVHENPDSTRGLELHLEVDGSLSLCDGHRIATEVETEIRRLLPGLSEVTTHIEPIESVREHCTADEKDVETVRKALDQFTRAHPDMPWPCHEIHVRRMDDDLSVCLHCSLPAGLRVDEAHAFSVKLETFLRHAVASLSHVAIHTEPADDSPR